MLSYLWSIKLNLQFKYNVLTNNYMYKYVKTILLYTDMELPGFSGLPDCHTSLPVG